MTLTKPEASRDIAADALLAAADRLAAAAPWHGSTVLATVEWLRQQARLVRLGIE